jgi:hypothetical protein
MIERDISAELQEGMDAWVPNGWVVLKYRRGSPRNWQR